MRYLVLIIFLLFGYSISFGQVYSLRIDDVNMITSNSAVLFVGKNISIENNSALIVNNSGTVTLKKNWYNNGEFRSGNGCVIFIGSELSTISGNTIPTFSYLNLSKDTEDTQLISDVDFNVINDLNIYSGTLEIDDISILIGNDLNIFYGGILENKSDLPDLIKVLGTVYNNSELNNDGWLEIGGEE